MLRLTLEGAVKELANCPLHFRGFKVLREVINQEPTFRLYI